MSVSDLQIRYSAKAIFDSSQEADLLNELARRHEQLAEENETERTRSLSAAHQLRGLAKWFEMWVSHSARELEPKEKAS